MRGNTLAIFLGCFADVFFKDFGKVIDIRNSAVLRDCLDLRIGCIQEKKSLINPFAIYIIRQSGTGILSKQGRQIAGIDIELFGQTAQIQIRSKIRIDTDHGFAD